MTTNKCIYTSSFQGKKNLGLFWKLMEMDASAPLQISGNKVLIFLEHWSPLASLKTPACIEIASKTLFRDNPIEGEETVLSKICLHIK